MIVSASSCGFYGNFHPFLVGLGVDGLKKDEEIGRKFFVNKAASVPNALNCFFPKLIDEGLKRSHSSSSDMIVCKRTRPLMTSHDMSTQRMYFIPWFPA
jgi:hypothetical protein